MDYIQSFLLVAILLIIIKTSNFSSQKNKAPKIILDSCALIDGRVLELVHSGFMSQQIIVPEFILTELQLLADGSDSHKRERARFGLDVVSELQNSIKVVIDTQNFTGPTDDRLIMLAKKRGALLYTTDYNLSKVATIQGVQVLNVNELAQSLRSVALPGEKLKVKILQRGSNPKQGVGYLEDGTMVVVDEAAKLQGSVVDIEVVRHLQTAAGKMVFAKQTRRKAAH